MKKSILFISALLALSMTACGTSQDSNEPVTPSTPSNNEPAPVDNSIIHGHGAPNNNQGSLYSLYVDDDTGKIYEKNKPYSAPVAAAVKFAENDEAKWIYTNCLAGDNFNKNSPVANAIRATLLSTNITLKCTLSIDTNSSPHIDAITYLAYNFGNILQKQAADSSVSFADADIVGYSKYNINADSYQLFLKSGDNMVDYTSYITSSDPMEQYIASNYVNRCLNNQLEKTCNFALCDLILSELDNFTVTNKVYLLNKTINTTAPLYDAQFGVGNYYLEFKDIEFKLSDDGNSLDYFRFTFRYGANDLSLTLEEDFLAEISDLRTTSFSVE